MSREIRFRAWHKDSREMLRAGVADTFIWQHEGQPIEIMQYTGLKDKNGKEIYEGDIINGFLELDGDNYDFTDVVRYEPPTFLCDNRADFPLDMYTELEIIGNIYENPELGSPEVKE